MDQVVLTEAFYYILLALFEPLHGYGIMQDVEAMSNGRVRLAAGTLYGALGTLVQKGWIAALPEDAGSRKKSYRITAEGRAVVVNELVRLGELYANGQAVLKGAHHA